MRPSLHKEDKKAIKNLSKSSVELTTAGLKQFLGRSSWIGKSNHYSRDVVDKLKKAPSGAEQERALAQYISASVCLHCNDGWSYLGRSVSCLLAGDVHRALHLAYYAELRASMSLLAGAGVGIFSNKHFMISGQNKVKKLRTSQGTHVVAWLALEQWARRSDSGQMFAEIVRPEGLSLNEWFSSHGGGTTLVPQAKSWFMQWGMDLGFATKDREARNASSYRPDGLPDTWRASSSTNLDFVRDMWAVLQPSAASPFEELDRHILRVALERHFFARFASPALESNPAFVSFVEKTVSYQALSPSANRRMKDFLLRRTVPSNPKIFRYSAVKPSHVGNDAFSVLSRALFLLRIATGSAQNLMHSAGFDSEMLSFWWKEMGEVRGLWPTNEAPESLSDLWADIDQALTDLEHRETSAPDSIQSVRTVAYGLDGILNVLSSHERVGLWGLFPT